MHCYDECQNEETSSSSAASDSSGPSGSDVEDSEAAISTAKPQIANGRAVRPSHWGITSGQIAELLARLREDPAWRPENNVYTLVQDFVIPWTRGTGVGYAVQVNMDSPKEVHHMISHAWCENAEEFLDTLLRTCDEGDVLFVCALSLYQCEDGHGPSIAEQLGQGPEESPFRRVLENIRHHQDRNFCSGKHYSLLKLIARLAAFWGLVSYFLPALIWGCIPAFNHCAMPEGKVVGSETIITWHWQEMTPAFRVFLPCAIAGGVLAAAMRLIMRHEAVYCGGMVVVPNRECDLYERLWCVYEIFVAMTLGVRVTYAPTMCAAGRVSTMGANCSSTHDAEKIRTEIMTRHSFEEVDRVVFITTRAARWHAARVVLTYGTELALLITAVASVSGYPPTSPLWYTAGSLFTCGLVVSTLYVVCRRAQGILSPLTLLVLGLAFLITALLLRTWGPSEIIASNICSAAASILSRSGFCCLVGLVGAKLFGGRGRTTPLYCDVIVGTFLLIVLVALWAPVTISLWSWTRSYPGISSSAYDLLMPSAFRNCAFSDHPYPCSVRAGTFVGLNVVQMFIFFQAARRWNVRVR